MHFTKNSSNLRSPISIADAGEQNNLLNGKAGLAIPIRTAMGSQHTVGLSPASTSENNSNITQSLSSSLPIRCHRCIHTKETPVASIVLYLLR